MVTDGVWILTHKVKVDRVLRSFVLGVYTSWEGAGNGISEKDPEWQALEEQLVGENEVRWLAPDGTVRYKANFWEVADV